MTETELPHYRLLQLGAPNRNGVQGNEPFETLDDLVTHHPGANRNAHLVNGVPQQVENPRRRSYGVVGGEIQEIEVARTDEYRVLTDSQVLLVKDFILEDSRLASGAAGVRDVDVPAPLAGYIGRVDAANGVVDILDRQGGEVIARARHLNPIAVEEGDSIAYGQSLGTQNRQGLPANAGKHVHFEIDTRYYQQYENYVDDLASGRLAIDAGRRTQGIEARAVVDDGVIRIGESSETVRGIQRVLNAEGYRAADNQAISEDGVYRLSMQAAVINYQRAHGLIQTGDLDAATIQRALPRVLPPEVNQEPGAIPRYMNLQGDARPDNGGRPVDPLLLEAEQAVRRLEGQLGRSYDEHSARMTASAACLARENGFTRIDHVVLSQGTEQVRAGENLFVVEGALDSPAHRLARMRTDEALATPVDQSLAQLQTMSESQQQQPTPRPEMAERQPTRQPILS